MEEGTALTTTRSATWRSRSHPDRYGDCGITAGGRGGLRPGRGVGRGDHRSPRVQEAPPAAGGGGGPPPAGLSLSLRAIWPGWGRVELVLAPGVGRSGRESFCGSNADLAAIGHGGRRDADRGGEPGHCQARSERLSHQPAGACHAAAGSGAGGQGADLRLIGFSLAPRINAWGGWAALVWPPSCC